MQHATPEVFFLFFFFNDTATTEIYTLSLHDALPISRAARAAAVLTLVGALNLPIIKFSVDWWNTLHQPADRKSTRLNSSHLGISYAVFCLKKKKTAPTTPQTGHMDSGC